MNNRVISAWFKYPWVCWSDGGSSFVTFIHAAAVVGIVVTNPMTSDSIVTTGFNNRVNLNENESTALYGFADGSGFYMSSGDVRANVFCRNHPMVVNAETFWYG
jgi:hypothetical protein